MSMCSASLLYALNSDGESLGISAGGCDSGLACEDNSVEAMTGLFTIAEREQAREVNVIAAEGVKEILIDLRTDLASQRIMNVLWIEQKEEEKGCASNENNGMS
jgi:hypothetical protein